VGGTGFIETGWHPGLVLLSTPDGPSIEIRPFGYQYPEADPATAGFDADWLDVAGEVRTADGHRWQFIDPCLLADETPRVSAWLRDVARRHVAPLTEGYESALGLLTQGDSDFLLTFLEPNLALSVAAYSDIHARVRVHLSANRSRLAENSWPNPAQTGRHEAISMSAST
jgi:hypothetical protein